MRHRLLRDGFVMLGAAFVLLRLLNLPPWDQSVDAYAYWTTRTGVFYGQSAFGAMGAYLYSPAWAQLLAPLVLLAWPLFNAIWTTINLATYWSLVGRLALPLLLFLPFPFEIVSGNVHLLYALAIVIGFRYPAAWALMLLTKITPGVGLVWFAARREWRSLAIALGVTAVIAAVSFLLAPDAWHGWVDTLRQNAGGPGPTPGWYVPIPLLVRLPIAVVIVAWGGLTDRRWTVPVAVVIGMPVIWLNSLAVLAALVPLAPRSISLPSFRPVPVERALAGVGGER